MVLSFLCVTFMCIILFSYLIIPIFQMKIIPIFQMKSKYREVKVISWGSQARREWLYLELNLLFRESITIVCKLHHYIKDDGVGGLSLSFSLSLLSSSI